MIAWFKMTPVEKIRKGYILCSANSAYQHSQLPLIPFISRLDKQIYVKWKIYLQLAPFIRWVFNKPLSYNKLKKSLEKPLMDISQRDPHQWYDDKQKYYSPYI